jgi:hypothetical protein
MKDQLNHNKKVETKLAQLATTLPFATNPEQVQAITTRGGKSTRDVTPKISYFGLCMKNTK